MVSVLFVIRSSKTGTGRYLYLTRKSVAESEAVDDVIEWAAASGSHRGDPFLARRRLGKNGQWGRLKLTRRMMNEALKHLAVDVGMEHAFASRSLRIGGATAMIAAGKSRETVKRAGGWAERSEVDKIYQQFTPADTGALAIPEVHFDTLGVEQVKMMLPPTFWDKVSRRREA